MKRLSGMLLLLASLLALASCSKAPLYSSDAEFEKFVQAKYSERSPDSKLSEFKATPLKSEGDVDKREFSAMAGDVKVTGYVAYDKKTNKSTYHTDFEYPK